jgi:predicted amidohydrolase YtcJ
VLGIEPESRIRFNGDMGELVPDLLLRNAVVWTGVSGGVCGAVALRGNRIVWTGSDQAAAALVGDARETLDLGGRMVIPGIVDSHNHVRLGTAVDAVQLAGATQLDEVRRRIDDWVGAHPDSRWVHGEGFDYTALPGGRHPRASDLAGVGGGRPVMLLDYSVHAAWLNETALEAFGVGVGVGVGSGDVAWGTVERAADGTPTGYVSDFAVKGIAEAGQRELEQVSPAYSMDAQYRRVVAGVEMAATYGITTVVEPQNSVSDLELFARARADGRLPIRLVAALFHPAGSGPELLDAFDDARRRFDDDRLRVGPVKLYIDDIVEPHTAAMFEPYANKDTVGRTYYEPGELADLVTRLDARDFQCFVHATGDRGISSVLDAVEVARQRNGPRDARHQVVHVECVREPDLDRFAELGVVACMQPRHCSPDIVAQWRENIGTARSRYAWPMRSLADRGAVLAFSSDWNVAEMDPMVGLYSALTRASLDGRQAWVPEERVDLDTALRAYTWGSAYSVFAEHDRGTLEVGKYADLAVLSRDLRGAEPDEVLDTRVDLTVVGGDVVHRSL